MSKISRKPSVRIFGSIFLLLSLVAGVYLVQQVVKYFSGAAGAPANLVVDTSTVYGAPEDAWRNLAQGGEERGRMLTPLINNVRALRPQYIRIDHVFDYYNQGELDNVIRDIQATGARPFIALSYMPPSISKSGSVTDLPKDWRQWEDTVQNLIQHVSGRNGLAISNVYYEVWNEPDLFGDFKVYGSKNYLDLYHHSAIGAARSGNTLPYKFGGPATTGYYPNWMNSLLSYASKNGLRLDFLSWHKYSKNLADYEVDVANARGLLEKYDMSGREMVITEIGPNGANDTAYDNTFGAIHLLATSIILQGEVDKTFTFEIKDGPGEKQYWGRWGIFTHEKFGTPVMKPRGRAITFLNSLMGGEKLNVFGQGSWVRAMAKKLGPNVIRIMVVNYDPKGTHAENVPLKLANLTSPNFSFKRTDFLGGTKSEEVSVTSSEWSTEVYMKPNSAAIFEIILK
jgi:hypothetical protein